MSNQNETTDMSREPIKEFYKLCVGDAPPSDLLNAIAEIIGAQVLLKTARPEGLEEEDADTSEYSHEFELEWRGMKLGVLYSRAPVPEEMARSLASRLYRLHQLNARIADKLFEAVARYGGDISTRGASPLVLGNMYLLVYADASKLNDDRRKELCDDLLKLPLSAAAAHSEGRACAICAESKGLEGAITELMSEYDTCAALSAPFDCGRIGHYVELMRLCLYAGKKLYPNERLYRFDEYASSALLLMAARHADLSLYPCETVTGLLRVDEIHGTDLSTCLYEHLRCFGDSKQAASNLNMTGVDFERNMRKLSMIMGGTLSNEKRFDMLYTYNLLALSCADFNVARFSAAQPCKP